MPRKNIIKNHQTGCFYHVYNRGAGKRVIFKSKRDYIVFMNLLRRYLGTEQTGSSKYYKSYHKDLRLLSFCLMPNHFHLLFYIKGSSESLFKAMHAISTCYSMYFNRKTGRAGYLFESNYKSSEVSNEPYLWHISRYIHLNPISLNKDYKEYPFSSIGYYKGAYESSWLDPGPIMKMFDNNYSKYADFLDSYISS